MEGRYMVLPSGYTYSVAPSLELFLPNEIPCCRVNALQRPDRACADAVDGHTHCYTFYIRWVPIGIVPGSFKSFDKKIVVDNIGYNDPMSSLLTTAGIPL
jgi:hypothetical protein